MGKSHKRQPWNEETDDMEYQNSKRRKQQDQMRRKNKKIKNALRSKNLDALVEEEF
jgi:hypothetical protein